jgi:hypothetical protein
MCEETKKEVENGMVLARELANHLAAMGAANARFPVEFDGDFYLVTVERNENGPSPEGPDPSRAEGRTART